jgi:23S rRNA (cytidine1920-2'-O)/16S rRNA (cytidine1409-2'-O)-methyltransferase
LVDFGHAATRSQAQRLIASGVEWRLSPLSAWQKVVKNGDDIPSVAEVRCSTMPRPNTSRAAGSSSKARCGHRAGGDGLRCLDVGQSTGGFTDCLLQHGAAPR